MARKRDTAEQIIGTLREAEVALAQGERDYKPNLTPGAWRT